MEQREVLAECYGMLRSLRDDYSHHVRILIDEQLEHIESVMGATGREWRARRLAEEREVA